MGSIAGSGRSPGEGNGNPLQYSCLGNPMDRETWQATVHGVTKSWTRLNEHTCMRKARRIRQDSFLINNDYNLSEVNLLSRV